MTDERQSGQASDNAGVRVPPPVLLVAAILAGIGLQRVLPLELTNWPGWSVLGWGMIGVGVAILVTGWVQFYQAKTNIQPHRPSSHLIRNGLYRHSRNPLYVAFLFLQVGIGLRMNNVWIVVLAPVSMFVITRFIIAREEAYLERAFGDAYVEYKRETRRWL